MRFGQGANGYAPLDEARRKARDALDRALSIDQDLPEARLLLGTLRLSDDWDFAAWDEETRRALAVAPGNADVVAAASGTALLFGRFDEAYALASRAIQLDPLNDTLGNGRAWAAFFLGRWDEAESELREQVRLGPTLPFRHGLLGSFLLARGRFAEARAEAEKEPLPYMRLTVVAVASHALGRNLTIAPATLPVTGQTTTYTDGDDGTLRYGIAWPELRFTNPDGTAPPSDSAVIDNLTGLMWTRDGNAPGPFSCGPATAKTWVGALEYISCLNTNNYLGHSDWRLPNAFEMRSLVNAGEANTAVWLNIQGFTHQQASYYWSSTTYPLDTTTAMVVHLQGGNVDRDSKTFDYGYIYVWPVRDAN